MQKTNFPLGINKVYILSYQNRIYTWIIIISVSLTRRHRSNRSVWAGCRWRVGCWEAGCVAHIWVVLLLRWWPPPRPPPPAHLWRNTPWVGSVYRWSQSPPAPLWNKQKVCGDISKNVRPLSIKFPTRFFSPLYDLWKHFFKAFQSENHLSHNVIAEVERRMTDLTW